MKQYTMTMSNMITIFRLVLLPLIVYLLVTGNRVAAFVIMLAALLSDGLDGYLARRFHQESRLGRFLDPLCDKIFLAVILVTLHHLEAIPLWIVVVIILRDFLILLGSCILLKNRSVVEPSNTFGKLTGFVFGAMILAFTIDLRIIGNILMYLSIPLMMVAFISYSVNYLKKMRGV
ncbi:CDP-alcohol phosphatidyltransferase family protein [candidate division WOR-3 bacterium]|nr:CDP-alcohol phosphatidyltransferase family protein [candidate division WOR-3 bacterium]